MMNKKLLITTGILILIGTGIFFIISQSQKRIPNPSAFYCEYLGYEYKIIKEERGERGICVFPDGRECDSWLFFAGKCGQEFSYCERFGNGKIDVMPESCAYSKECAVCILPDGTRCLEFEYALGRCP